MERKLDLSIIIIRCQQAVVIGSWDDSRWPEEISRLTPSAGYSSVIGGFVAVR
jgi:hypothetical protein